MLNDISILEYFQLKDTTEYDVFIDILKPKNLFCGKEFDVSKLTYDEFHTIISIFNSGRVELLKDLFIHLYKIRGDINQSAERMFFNESIFAFFRVKTFIKNMIENKLSIENKLLYCEPDSRLIEIGASDKLKPFSTMITKISLGKMFGVDPYEIGGWQYSKVVNILATNNALNEVQRLYAAK